MTPQPFMDKERGNINDHNNIIMIVHKMRVDGTEEIDFAETDDDDDDDDAGCGKSLDLPLLVCMCVHFVEVLDALTYHSARSGRSKVEPLSGRFVD